MASEIPMNDSTRFSSASSGSSSNVAKLELEQTAPSCCDEAAVNETELRRFTGLKDKTENASHASLPSISHSQDVDCGSWKDAPNSKCHASFGDRGTTATIGAFGQLLQLSGFLGVGSSGMFSVDHVSVSEPYFVTSRANDLHRLSQQPFHYGPADDFEQHYGLRFPSLFLKTKAQPQLKWTHWRWPRHEYSRGHFAEFPRLKLTIQWMVHDNIVLQQCFLEYDGKASIDIDVEFSKSMVIRDLDHLSPRFGFNQRARKHDTGLGRDGHSWNCVNDFNTKPSEDDRTRVSERIPSPNIPLRRSRSRTEQIFQPEQAIPDLETRPKSYRGVSVTTSVAFDGKPQVFDSTDSNMQHWRHAFPGCSGSNGQVQTLEVIVAYRMNLLTASNREGKAHVIPWEDMTVSEFLQEHPRAQTLPLCGPTPMKESMPGMLKTRDDLPDDPASKGSKDTTLPKHDESDDKIRTQTRCVPQNPVGTPGKTSPQHKSDDVYNYLEYAARRNLEHILSVCAVQTTPQTHDTAVSSATSSALDDAAVALTCGDMSGHRICWSASFFAFRFLISTYKSLDHLPKEPLVEDYLHRIGRTCRGHLKWLHSAQRQDSGQRFGPNYWVTGKRMDKPETSGSWVARESPLDTVFQILKAADCMELWPGDKVGAEPMSNWAPSRLMSEWAPSWLIAMEDSDKRKKYAWPHAEYEGVNTFRLDDHVWIWRALKALEKGDHQAWQLMSEKVLPGEGGVSD